MGWKRTYGADTLCASTGLRREPVVPKPRRKAGKRTCPIHSCMVTVNAMAEDGPGGRASLANTGQFSRLSKGLSVMSLEASAIGGDQSVEELKRELAEAHRREAATAEILKVISCSPTDLQPVFDGILKSAIELCEAHLGLLNLYDREKLRTVAQRGGNPGFAKWVFDRGPFLP